MSSGSWRSVQYGGYGRRLPASGSWSHVGMHYGKRSASNSTHENVNWREAYGNIRQEAGVCRFGQALKYAVTR